MTTKFREGVFMEFEQLYAPSLKELFVQQLQDMILSGDLPMGTRLPPERELCQKMRVSRAVVNSGIAELSRLGFLEVRPRQGTYVADYRRNGNMDTLMAIMRYNGGVLGKDEIRSILEEKGKYYTQIKIDEITNLGAVRIRLRSLLGALEQ